jgi:hypothetical protein
MALPLPRIGLRSRVGLLGLIGFAGLVVLGCFYHVALDAQTRSELAAAAATADRDAVAAIDMGFEEIGRSETDFLAAPSAAGIARHRDLEVRVGAALDTFRARLAAPHPDRLARSAERLSAGFGDYAGQFDRVAATRTTVGLNDESGLADALAAADADAEQTVNAADSPRLLAQMLMIERVVLDFLAHHGDRSGRDDLDLVTQLKVKFDRFLNTAELPDGQRDALAGKIDAYRDSFFALATALTAFDGEVEKLVASRAAIQPLLADADDAVSVSYRRASADSAASRAATTTEIWFSLAAMAAFIAAGTATVSLRIADPIVRLSDILARLARGEATAGLGDTERRDEIGTMARAALILEGTLAELRAAASSAARTGALPRTVGETADHGAEASVSSSEPVTETEKLCTEVDKLLATVRAA